MFPSKTVIAPGGILGIVGGGQLGRMLALAARAMGFRLHVLTPEADSPAGQVADRAFLGDWADERLVSAFAQSVQVATYEFENVPLDAVAPILKHTRLFPSAEVLAIAQNRIREKTFLRNLGIPTVPFVVVNHHEELYPALAQIGAPAVFKSATLGYDGKSQIRVDDTDSARKAWDALSGRPGILEVYLRLKKELSMIVARDQEGRVVLYPAFENLHTKHILDLTVTPARVSPEVLEKAAKWAVAIAEKLNLVGLICVEFFLSDRDELLVNELAPRPHNSGHLTLEACITGQFEQLARILTGLPMGSTALRSPAAMANLLGDLWPPSGEPDWAAVLKNPEIKLHLYGKQEARPGRKMGHLTLLAPTVEAAAEGVVAAREGLLNACEGAKP